MRPGDKQRLEDRRRGSVRSGIPAGQDHRGLDNYDISPLQNLIDNHRLRNGAARSTAGAEHGSREPTESGGQNALLEYWRILSWRKGTILALVLAGGLVAALITSTQPKTYRAQMSLEVQDIS